MGDWLEQLAALRALPERHVLGLNSGTSADGIDAALVAIAGAGDATRVRVLAFDMVPFDAALQARVHDAADGGAAELAALNFVLGEAFADAAAALLARAGAPVHLVGSHGQTVAHLPRSAGHAGATLQIGEGAVLAERLGVPVVCDFRVRDVAAGGEGAPLVPLADHLLFHRPGKTRGLQNIGGIANMTVVGPTLAALRAFDSGPGNVALDEVVRVATGGAERLDAGGARALRGTIDAALVAELFAHPFFATPAPRSTGREAFGPAWTRPLLARFAGRLDDLVATLTRFSAEAIARSFRDLCPGVALDDVVVSGGGVHNRALMAHLAALFAPVPVITSDAEGIHPDAKEAVAFALLANETLFGRPGDVPAATGARGPRVLGKIVPP